MLPPLVGTGFQVQCPPLVGVLPTVRSPYWVRYRSSSVLSLGRGSSQIRPGFHVPELTRVSARAACSVAYGTITRSGATFQRASATACRSHDADPTTPSGDPDGLGWSPVARRYWGSRGCFLFLRVLRCFSSPGLGGDRGIDARLAAPPRFSQPSTPTLLMTPRHPPRALRGLTTPTRRRKRRSDRMGQASLAARRRRHDATSYPSTSHDPRS